MDPASPRRPTLRAVCHRPAPVVYDEIRRLGTTPQRLLVMETRSGWPGNERDGAPAALDEDRGFAVFWFNPVPTLRTHARYPSQYPSRFDQRRPHRPRQDCAAGGDPGVRID